MIAYLRSSAKQYLAILGSRRNVGRRSLGKKRLALLAQAGFGLLEGLIAGIFLITISLGVAFMSVSEQRAMVMQDTQTALVDELIRQAEIVRGLPMTGNAGLIALMPIISASGLGTSGVYTPVGGSAPLPLNGYMLSTVNGTDIIPTVTWTRTRVAPSPDLPLAVDEILVTASITRLGTTIQRTTTVFRVFDGQGS